MPSPEIERLVDAVRASVPAAMRERAQWLLWRFESYEGDSKLRKVPYWISGRKRKGKQGSDDDRAELATLEQAITHLQRGRYDGLGFAFLEGDGLIGIDIDKAIDRDSGEVAERCRKIIEACASYTELSPSGTGVHIIAAGHCKSEKDNSIGLEVFCGSQFFTVTGARWVDAPAEVAPLDEGVLGRLLATIRAAKQATKQANPQAAKASKAAKPVHQGAGDFERVNAAALALLDLWVPSLLPKAVKTAGGAWRVSSKDLGRQLQEDLSLHPSGIQDFGTEAGLTPIDVVVQFGGKTPGDALRWLAGALGMQISKAKPAGARAMKSAAASGAEAEVSVESQPQASANAADEADAAAADAASIDEAVGDPAWRDRLHFERGRLQDCRENVFHMLMHHPRLSGLVAFDQFAHRVLKMRPPPWVSDAGEWTTNDDYELGLWLLTHEGLLLRGDASIVAGVAMAAARAKFHPVKDWLAGLKWDGTERLGYWMHECLQTPDTTYYRMVGTMFLLGMVARALTPGCQMDHMIVLEGGQGLNKSSALRVLAGTWFADTPVRIGDKDALLSLAGVMLYEIAELDSFNKAEVTAIKQYVSGRVDRVREPYTRRPADRPRSCVLAGTTNQHEYFKDPTGSRRFWPIAVSASIDLARLRDWREQLFAEAVHRHQAGERHYPTREEEQEFFWPEQDAREIADPWFEKVAVWLEAPEQMLRSSFLGSEILTGALYVPIDRIDGARNMATRVGVIMHRLGWRKVRDSTGARLWRYVRPKAVSTAPAQPVVAQPVAAGLSSDPEPDQAAVGGPTSSWSSGDFDEDGDV